MIHMIDQKAGEAVETEETEQYEGTPEELTGFKKEAGPARFDRKKVMITICVSLSVIVTAGLIFNSGKKQKQTAEGDAAGYAARAPRDFLEGELSRSLRSRGSGDETALPETAGSEPEEDTLPQAVPVSYSGRGAEDLARNDGREPPPYENSGGSRMPAATAPFSALVPSVEGSLFPGTMPQPAAQQYPYLVPGTGIPGVPAQAGYPGALSPDAYAPQGSQNDTNTFYSNSPVSGGSQGGAFLPDDLVWIGTVIPAVLETSVNTDLPGNVIARVSENVYDSRTGQKLLIPQGTLLMARYNSSVSYAQHRVQIVWDLLIRPDGYQLELGGMNAVDERGMAGAKAEYRENWFEYLKAAGLITLFSVANSKMAEEAARYGSAEMAAGVTASNAEFVAQTGGTIVSRAMNIQPTLIINNGEKINVMLNKNLFLPPVDNYPVTKPYVLK